MNVTKDIKRLEKSNINLTLTVPNDEVKDKYQQMIKEYVKTIQIPGFRKGHVPQNVLEQKFGDALKQDAAGRIIEAALKEVFDDKELPRSEKPLTYTYPELQGEPVLELDKDFVFSVIYDVLPDVKIDSWKGFKIEYPYAEVTKEDIDKELEILRERNSVILDKDDAAAAAKNDAVTIDFKIFDEDGTTVLYERNDFAFTLGINTQYYQIDDDIIGMKKGETKEFTKTFSDDYFETSAAGKTRKASVALKALKEKKLPDLDDDLAQDIDEKFNTLDDLKNDIKERLQKSIDEKTRTIKTELLLEKLREKAPVTLPESMIQAEIEGRVRRLAGYYGTSAENILQMIKSGEGAEEREKEWREPAVKSLHSRLIIETLLEEQNIEVTDEDIDKEIEKIAKDHRTTVEEVNNHYDEQAILYLKEEIKEKKLIDIMFAENTFKQGKKESLQDFLYKRN